MRTITKIDTVPVVEDVQAGGNVLHAGDYQVRMPADYEARLVTGEDILLDDQIAIVDEDRLDGMQRQLINSRRADCEGCGEAGVHVDTTAGEIIPHCTTLVTVEGETLLMADPDGHLRCDDCSTVS